MIDCFNAADAVALANFIRSGCHKPSSRKHPVIGKAIHEMFVNEFATSKMVCIVEHIFEGWRMGYHGMEKIRSGCEDADSFMCKTIK